MTTLAGAWVCVGGVLKEIGRADRTPGSGALVPELPWTMPARQAMADTGKDVLAYYHTFPLYWRSDTPADIALYSDYLSPTGASSAYHQFGGRWRQRPYPIVDNTGLTDADRISWMTVDVQNAWNVGIDAFRVEILTETTTMGWRWLEHVSKLWTAVENFNASHAPGFRVCPDMDGSSISANNGSATVWADFIAPLLKSPAAYTWQNTGRPVVFCYQFNNVPGGTTWWTTFYNELVAQGVPNPAIIPAYQGSDTTVLDGYKSGWFGTGKFVALHNWSTVNWSTDPSAIQSGVRSWATTNSVPFVGSVGPAWENDRPDLLKETEGYGLQTMQHEWQASINNGDPLLSIVSWCDHLEAHNIRPSTGYQWVPYDFCAYYLAWFKTGTAPTITRDAVYYAHRMHKGTTTYDTSQQTGGAFAVAFGPPPDLVFAYAFLTATADVTITTGGTAHTTTGVPAGVTQLTAALIENDTPSFKVTRSGVDVVPQFSSAFPTRSVITWQDLAYRMGSSTRAPMTGVQSNLPQDR